LKKNTLREESLYKGLFQGSLWLTILSLGAIAVYVFWEGLSFFAEIGTFDFLLGIDWDPINHKDFGILPMIIASIYTTVGAILLSAPLAIGCAIYISEVNGVSWLRDILQMVVAVLAGIPSVVYGLLGVSILVPWVQTLGEGPGLSMLAAIIILAVMILPSIISISQDAIESVSADLKRGSLALGATRWQTIRRVVIPLARPGIVAAVVLSVNRAFGEAMAVKMVIGNIQTMPNLTESYWFGLLSPARTLTTNIIGDIEYAKGLHLQSLFATGAILLLVNILVNYFAYLFINLSSRRLKGKL